MKERRTEAKYHHTPSLLAALVQMPIAALIRRRRHERAMQNESKLELRVGGPAVPLAKLAESLNIPICLIGAQATPFDEWCRAQLQGLGAKPFIVKRDPGLNGTAPTFKQLDLSLPAGPITPVELEGEPCRTLFNAEVVLIGRDESVESGTLAMLNYVLARSSFPVLVPSSNLLEHPRFKALAERFAFVGVDLRMNSGNCSEVLDETPRTLPPQVSQLLGGCSIGCILYTSSTEGFLWDGHNGNFSRWNFTIPLTSPSAANPECLSDDSAIEVLTAAYVALRRIFGELPKPALRHALHLSSSLIRFENRNHCRSTVSLPIHDEL